MSTRDDFDAAAKTYGNAIRARKLIERQYDDVHSQLQKSRAEEDAAREAMMAVAQDLASDVP